MKIDPFLPNRILMTADTISGVWHYSLDLARAYQAHDISIELATLGPSLTPNQREEASTIPNLRIHESNYPLEWSLNSWEGVDEGGKWLQHLAHEFSPDLIHFNHYCNAHLEFDQPKLLVAHGDVLTWWRAVQATEAPSEWDEYRTRVRRGFRSASTIIAPTRSYLEELLSDYGPFRRARVIPNGRVDFQLVQIPKEPLLFTAAGRLWDPGKNISLLSSISADLPWPIYASGRKIGPNHEKIETPGIQLIGDLSDDALSNEYAKASIYVNPAKYEPFGLSILEAAMNDCALVLADIPTLRENWEGAAVFVNPNDPEAFKFEITSLIQSSEERKGLALRAKHRSRKFSLRSTAELYIKEYRHLLQSQLLVSSGQFFPNRGRTILPSHPRSSLS